MFKKVLLILIAIVTLGLGRGLSAQERTASARAPKLYITSYFDVDVYKQYRKVATLKRGVRAQVLKTTSKWILVRFWANGQSVVGWIRRN